MREREVEILQRKPIEMLVLCGPTGVGKTTAIQELVKDERFAYPTPYTDRPLREGETDKISLSREEFDRMEEAGEFCAVNGLYGNRYGTSTALINRIIAKGKTVVLDFPYSQLGKLGQWETKHYYLAPPSEEELIRRLTGAGRTERIPEALSQLREEYDNVLVNEDSAETAHRIILGKL